MNSGAMPAGVESTIHAAAVLIEFVGSLFLVAGCVRGLAALVASRGSHAGIVHGRLRIANGVIAALGFKLAATLLKTIGLQSWQAILMFAAIFALRTVVKNFLVWEEGRLRSEIPDRGLGP
jgi:uncharacterized membrane protein